MHRSKKLWELSASELAAAYRRDEATPLQVVTATLERIEKIDPQINAFTAVDTDRALASAADAQARIQNGDPSPLCGVPIAIKELFAVEGLPWTGQSLVREGVIANGDAALVRQLRHAGAIIVGTTRTHELAWGITTQHQILGGTKNPWNQLFTPGGSSGGSAAAVAAGMATLALGSDTGGSTRIPAAFCGVVGFKPSRGLVDPEGLLPHAPRFDHPGWLGRNVDDVATLLNLFSDESATPSVARKISELRIGMVSLDSQHIGPEQRDAFTSMLATAERQGAHLVPVEWTTNDDVFKIFRDLQAIDAINTHRNIYQTWPEMSGLYGPDIRSRLEYSETVTPAMVGSAESRLDDLADTWTETLASVDVLVSPVSASGPSRIADPDWTTIDGERVALRDAVIGFCAPANMVGAPACSIPAGRDSDGIPIGVQILGAPGQDAGVLAAARLLTQAVDRRQLTK